MTENDRLIFHIDVNSAFLSWEAVRRVKNGEPDLRLIPSCVGGDPQSRRSIVSAKSIPAKRYQIHTGEPVSMALRKCPELVVVRPDFALYKECSKAFKDICRLYAPVVEEFSIDECFMDFTGTKLLYPDPAALARQIKDRIRDELGFTVNIGIARNKLCAKMASDFEKPDKVHTLFPEEIPDKLWKLPVGALLFVGKASVQALEKAHIRTIGDLAHADVSYIKNLLGEKAGAQAHRYANGIDDSPVRAEREERKGYSHDVTVDEDITTTERADAILLSLAEVVAARMRKDKAKAGSISVSVRYLDFKTRSHQCRLKRPTDRTREIYETACGLLAELWKDHRPLRFLSISLTNLSRDGAWEQMSLFEENDPGKNEREEKMDKTVDALRSRFGADIIKRGAVIALENGK